MNEISSDNNNLLVYTNEYGVRSLPVEIWSQIFDFKKIDSNKFNQQHFIGTPKNKIDEEYESGDENATTAKKIKEVPQKTSIKKESSN